MLTAYALISHHRAQHGSDLTTLLHRGHYIDQAQQHIHNLIKDLLTEAATTGDLRNDIAPDELATYCLHALTAASNLPTEAAVHRLVTLTLAAMRPSH